MSPRARCVPAASFDSTAGARPAVLIVDDEPLIRMLGATIFSDSGIEAFEAGGNDDALGLLRDRPQIALMISDCRLARGNGVRLAEAARALRPDLRIVLTSGSDEHRDAGFEFIPKPWDARRLEALLRA